MLALWSSLCEGLPRKSRIPPTGGLAPPGGGRMIERVRDDLTSHFPPQASEPTRTEERRENERMSSTDTGATETSAAETSVDGTAFTTELIENARSLWDHMLAHRFLRETRDGEIPFDTFARWMRQDHLFVEAAIPFMGVLLGKAPREDRTFLTEAIEALERELELFRERAAAAGVDLGSTDPAFINHAYVQFLMATAHGASYPEAFAVLYGAEKAYFDSWSVVEAGLDESSPWYPFVDNWAGEEFSAYVAALEQRLDAMAAASGPAERRRMAELFETTVRYEIAFWEMAYRGTGWPGMGEPEGGG